MRDLSNCLNTLLVLLCLPCYLLGPLAGMIGFILQQLAPHWLPAWAQPISPPVFLVITFGPPAWYIMVLAIQGARISGPLTDFTAIEAIPNMFQDGLSGYLLGAGLIIGTFLFLAFV